MVDTAADYSRYVIYEAASLESTDALRLQNAHGSLAGSAKQSSESGTF